MHLEQLPGCGAKVAFSDEPQSAAFLDALNNAAAGGAGLGDKTASALREGIARHGLLVFPSMKNLSVSGHLHLTAVFGKPGAHPQRGKPPGLPCLEGTDCLVEVATNDPTSQYCSAQTRADHWHADVTFSDRPPSYTSLLAKQLPGIGLGDTLWSSTSAAFDSLSPALQSTVATLNAVHRDRSGLGCSATHPIVREIPLGGGQKSGAEGTEQQQRKKAALFVNDQFTSHIDGWDAAESDPLMAFLRHRSTDPTFVYRHRWAVGDLVVWDNRQTLHHGVYDFGDAVRTKLVTVN